MPAPKSNPIVAARSRAACALFSLGLGILGSWELPGSPLAVSLAPPGLFIVAVLLGAIALICPMPSGAVLGPSKLSGGILCVAVFVFGLGWGETRLREHATDEPFLSAPTTKDRGIFRVTVLDNPRFRLDGETWSCLVRIRAVVSDSGSAPINRKAWLSVRSVAPPRAGDRMIAGAHFRAVQAPRNPGEFDLRRWAADRGIVGSLHVAEASMLRPDESPPGRIERAANLARKILGALRARAADTVDTLGSRASPDSRHLLRGLLLGENAPATGDGLASFYDLGLAHILSISGFHLMVFAAAALFTLRLLGDLGRLEPVLVGAAVLLFLAIVSASSPLVRAATILLVLLGAECLGRRYDRLTLLCWTAVAILLFRPSELWSLGFQLSFGLTAALLGLAPRLSLRLFPPPLGVRPRTHWLWSRVRHAFVALLVTGVLCWALSAPWIAANVGIFNPLSVFTGILITPIIVLALWIGYAALLVGLVFPAFTQFAAVPIGAIADLSVATARWWDSIPIAVVRLPPLSQVWALAAATLLAVWFVRPRLRRPGCLATAGVLLLWAAIEMTFPNRLPPGVSARVYLLDVAQATCTIVRTPDSSHMISAGTPSPGARGRDLVQIARAVGVWRLDSLVLDCTDLRGVAGAPDVLRTLCPGTLWLVGACEPIPAQIQPLVETATRLGARVQRVSTIGDAVRELPPPLNTELPRRDSDSAGGMAVVDIPASSR